MEFHPLSRVGAVTLGYLYDVLSSRVGRIGFGGDVTVYHVPQNLRDDYGSPASFHIFLPYRGVDHPASFSPGEDPSALQ